MMKLYSQFLGEDETRKINFILQIVIPKKFAQKKLLVKNV